MLSSSLAAGVIVGGALLIIGPVSGNVDLDIESSRFDALWLAVGLPLVALIVFALLSPLSVCFYRLLGRSPDDGESDTGANADTGNV